MLMDATKTVREFAIENPGATRVFEKLKIDYCCGGNQPLTVACEEKGLNPQEVLQLLQQAEQDGIKPDPSSAQSQPLTSLINVIVEKHHVFTRNELERLTELLEKVWFAHGQNHPELLAIQSQFQILRAELEQHMLKEERILFPYITRLETAMAANQPAPFAPFGTAQNPITVMRREHDAAGEILKAIRALSKDFIVPEDGCFTYQTVYKALEELEADLHQHIHLENNILFPGSLELEQKAVTM